MYGRTAILIKSLFHSPESNEGEGIQDKIKVTVTAIHGFFFVNKARNAGFTSHGQYSL